jgi:hypothetical protein
MFLFKSKYLLSVVALTCILATKEIEIRRIESQKKVNKTPISTIKVGHCGVYPSSQLCGRYKQKVHSPDQAGCKHKTLLRK